VLSEIDEKSWIYACSLHKYEGEKIWLLCLRCCKTVVILGRICAAAVSNSRPVRNALAPLGIGRLALWD